MTATFDPAKVSTIFHNNRISGYADGTFIQVSRDSESFTKTVGADGEVARVATADDSGTIKVTLLQSSAGNDIMSNELAKDELTKKNIGPVFVKDASGRTVAQAAEAWLSKPAEVSLGKDIEAREWTIVCAHLQVFVGGNS